LPDYSVIANNLFFVKYSSPDIRAFLLPEIQEVIMDTLEQRAFPFTEVRVDSEEESPRIRGYAAVFDKLSVPLYGFREKISPGAFARSIEKDDIRALWNHDPNYVLGRTKNNTLLLEEDERGLKIEIIPPDTQWGRDAAELIRRGDVDQMSFAFNTVKDLWENPGTDKAIRTLVQVNVVDVSPATFPAYPQTTVKTRTALTDAGLNFEALEGLFVRSQRGVSFTRTDVDLINTSIEILSSYLPAEPESRDGDGGAAPERLRTLRRQLEIASL
jgi:HK97 family phage prohead protease